MTTHEPASRVNTQTKAHAQPNSQEEVDKGSGNGQEVPRKVTWKLQTGTVGLLTDNNCPNPKPYPENENLSAKKLKPQTSTPKPSETQSPVMAPQYIFII